MFIMAVVFMVGRLLGLISALQSGDVLQTVTRDAELPFCCLSSVPDGAARAPLVGLPNVVTTGMVMMMMMMM